MSLPSDLRIIIVRRGLMRACYPMTQYGLDTTSPPELAASAIVLFMQLQTQYPARADLPITSKTGQMGLFLPFADEPLQDEPLWAVLAGQWNLYDLDVMGALDDAYKIYPCTVLNLSDLRGEH